VSHMNTYAYLGGSAISPGASPGLLTVISTTNPLNYGLSTYNCEINGTTAITQHDQLSSTGQVNLSQMSLNVTWGFTPTVGQSFTIMNHSSIIGEFANVNIPTIANYVYKIDYNPTNIILNVYLRFYEDFDQDTYGNANTFQDGPTAPVNFVLDNSDCDDTNSAINPAATEVCDLIDNDCDGDVDEGVLITYYADADMDTYGDPAVTTMACSAPLGYVANNNDCNDNDANEKPNQIWYIDADNDAYGNSSIVQCLRPLNGFLLTELAIGSSGLDDCDDMDMSLYPNSPSNIVTSIAPGNWTTNTTWQCGIPLTQADSIFIYNPVYLDDTISIIADIEIEGLINSGKLTIGNNQILTIGSPSQHKELILKPNAMLVVNQFGKLIIYGKLLAHPNSIVDNNGIIEIK
ncbi:MAG TPA: putative metal-binding motif-containing protein, partial [Saprospiraceae bacterium]|nr:putative metal-binding motif-containing protein [Saprospiraceae bacterium]